MSGSKKSPSSRREKQLVRLRERRAARTQRREKMLELVVSGFERGLIARKFEVSLKTVQREIDRALNQRSFDRTDRHLRLQVERLSKALQIVDLAVESGDVKAVNTLLALMSQLDRYHNVAARAAMPAPRAPCPEIAAAPLALTRERTPETS